MRTRALKIGTLLAAFAALVALVPSCASGGGGSTNGCTPNETQSCSCASGASGSQTCNATGSAFGACSCGGGVCAAGASQACTCSNGVAGSQTCDPTGSSWLNCVCSVQPCSAANPAGTCASGLSCVAGACCAAAQACGSNCCAAGSSCVNDGTGNRVCAQTCTSSKQCPAAKGCCALLADGKSGACFANNTVAGQSCLCTTEAECTSKSCGETVNSAGNPGGAGICVANDGKPYHGCNGSVACAAGYCCYPVGDTANNICLLPCLNNTQCGGSATCQKLPTGGTCNGSPGVCR